MEVPVEQFSEAEIRFDLWRRRIGLLVGPFLGLAVFLFASDLAPEQQRLAGILTLVIVFWVTEAIPIPATALLGPALCVLVGVGEAKEVFRHFGDPIIFVFLGSFLIAQAMTANGLDRRVALALLQSPAIGRSPGRIRLAMGAAAVLISMWISNTATAAILFPIAVGICDTLERIYAGGSPESQRSSRSYATGLMLIIAYGASIGGLGTPVGTPPNLIGLGMMDTLAGRRIPFFGWMLLGVPVMVVMFAVLCLLLRFLHPAPHAMLQGLDAAIDRLKLGLPAWGRAQTFTVMAFVAAVVLWILPGVFALVQGTDSPLYRALSAYLNEGVVALLAASLLFLIPVSWGPPRGALDWKEAVHIDWGTILLFGGGLSLGSLMYTTGLARKLADGLLGSDGTAGLWTITAVATLFAVLITETTSNTASASMVVPIAIAVAKAAGVSPIPPALGATIGSSLAFMLPVSTPPNAIVYGSGRVSIVQMFRAGVLLDAMAYVLLLLLLRLLCPLLGYM
jgi:sodium-dependent dicarboxylate transporter 2/3/5